MLVTIQPTGALSCKRQTPISSLSKQAMLHLLSIDCLAAQLLSIPAKLSGVSILTLMSLCTMCLNSKTIRALSTSVKLFAWSRSGALVSTLDPTTVPVT